jgi:membrane-associated protein
MFDLISIIKTSGYIGVSAIVFAESGILLGMFLPGDSLLFTAGFLASQNFFDIRIMVPLVFVSAILGDNVGYAFGNRIGYKIFNKEDSLFFKKSNLQTAQVFFEKHGGKTLILARFIPVVRTFAPILAGVGKMHYRTFMIYNLVGSLLWAIGLTMLGYYLGTVIPNVDKYLLPIVAVIIIISVAPVILKFVKNPELRAKLIAFIKNPKGFK